MYTKQVEDCMGSLNKHISYSSVKHATMAGVIHDFGQAYGHFFYKRNDSQWHYVIFNYIIQD